MAPGRYENNFKSVIFTLMLGIEFLSTSCEIALRCMPQNSGNDKSTLIQLMAWCRKATSHYLSQCWPKAMSPYGITGPRWVNSHGRSSTHIPRLWHHNEGNPILVKSLMALPWRSLAPVASSNTANITVSLCLYKIAQFKRILQHL